MADSLKWLNLGFLVLGCLAAIGALNKMESAKTKPCIMGATLLIAVGLFGQALGLAYEDWAQYADTALYGGILALLIASQRVHTWFLERFANPIASVVLWIAGAVFLVGLLGGCAQMPQTPPQQPERQTEIPVHVYEREGLQVRLLAGPCVDGRSAMRIAVELPQYADRFRAIESVWPMVDGSRRPYAGCWAELSAEEAQTPETVFVLIFSDGQAFVVSKREFLAQRGQGGA